MPCYFNERDAEGAAGGVDERVAARARDEDGVRPAVRLAVHARRADRGCAAAAQEQQQLGITTILTRLGENLTTAEEAEEVTQHYLDVLDKVAAAGLDAHISVKPTQLGLDLDRGSASATWTGSSSAPSSAATSSGSTWRARRTSIRRSSSSATRARRPPRVGIAIQAYLYRTAKDIEALIPLGAAIRIVKGAYLEPPEVAYPKKADVDESFFKLCTRLLARRRAEGRTLLHIATHDIAARRPADRVHRAAQRPEVGLRVRDALRHPAPAAAAARAGGQRLRVLISYGEYWFPWYMRRLAERPANVWFVVRTMFG